MDEAATSARHRRRSDEIKTDAASGLGVVVRFAMMAMLLVMMMSTLSGKRSWSDKSNHSSHQQNSH
jgi:hypothetical protein